MTPLEINTAARQRYNAVGDDFWSDAEIYNLIYQAECELATEGFLFEQTFTTVSVSGQQEYDWPTNAIAIKRITYNGLKLAPFTFREDDVLTQLNQATTSTGAPNSYAVWNNIFYLRPTPGTSALTIKVWAYVKPQTVSAASTLEAPTEFHMEMVHYILGEMCAKNKNYEGASYYKNLWTNGLMRAKRFARKKLIGDSFQFVKNIDILPHTDLGNF